MSNTKEIRTQIKSIKSTKKITKAMEMVAASKMHKAQERMSASRPYYNRIKNVISHVLSGHLEFEHPYLHNEFREKSGYIFVSTDRGLCGGLNANLFRHFLKQDINWNILKPRMRVCTIGKKAEVALSNLGFNITASVTNIGTTPKLSDVIGGIQAMISAYENGEIDHLYIVYNKFINTMTQTPTIEQVLPISDDSKKLDGNLAWDYIYEPMSPKILDILLKRYVESLAYQAVVENVACEQAARMIAMKNATDNADQFIDDLLIQYNKARQANITKELSEIVAGADAV